MLFRPSSLRSFAVAAVALVAVTGAVANPSTAAASTPSQSVTVLLTAPHPAALARLALTQGLSRPQRLAALRRLLPGRAAHAAVERQLRAQGFSIVHETAWSVTASAPAAAVRAVFGAQSAPQAADAGGLLPRLPQTLRGRVSAVFPTTGGPAAFHHSATAALDGADFRNAYAPSRARPSTGQQAAGTTIATLQLADFAGGDNAKAADLTTYARRHGLSDPVADGRYQAVSVDGGPRARDNQPGYDIEVDLDQQSILSTAPAASQHAYFAPNTSAGMADVFASVLDDVTGNDYATAPDPNITALSTSWGQCESWTGARAIKSFEPIIESVVAAGVTVFASAGDYGIYDCGYDNQPDVDYPASSPAVVAVGGTRLSAAASAPNTGRNWTERSWTCTGLRSCFGGGGTGGGASGSGSSGAFSGFPAPAYQRAGIDDAPFAGAGTRLVPDIAADAARASGFRIYTSDGVYSPGVKVGGTSLAAPVSAALFTNALAESGRRFGVGDIHNALYSAYRLTRSLPARDRGKPLRDVTAGANGAAADRGSDPTVKAGPGYDTNTGVGAVLWQALVPYLKPRGAPKAIARLTCTGAHHARMPLRTTATWRARQGRDESLLGSATVTVTKAGARRPLFVSHRLSGRKVLDARPGTTYLLSVRTTDLAGRTATSRSTVHIPIDDSRFTFRGRWARHSAPSDIGGSHAVGLRKGARARITATGRAFALRVRLGPRSGRLAVRRGSRLVKIINLYAPRVRVERVPILTAPGRVSRTFTLVDLGSKTRASKGREVAVDALYVR